MQKLQFSHTYTCNYRNFPIQ
uniref:Uncharacterized protein n=1 Tax=Rhizophora mucronata TaxID=61149 RepID=A0A2P2N4J4_RHIMU